MSKVRAGGSARKILVPSNGPEAWRGLLAEPDKQWRRGYSARSLAYCWEAGAELPTEIASLFEENTELLFAIPEHKVPLPGGSRESQNDVFALIRHGDQTCSMTVEGKVNEPFGPTVGEWLNEPSPGKRVRMRAICELLGLVDPPPAQIRYQLLHRTASAVIEAIRFKTDNAAMVVHSFSQERMWFADFAAFSALFGISADPDRPVLANLPTGMQLRLGWASGDSEFLGR